MCADALLSISSSSLTCPAEGILTGELKLTHDDKVLPTPPKRRMINSEVPIWTVPTFAGPGMGRAAFCVRGDVDWHACPPFPATRNILPVLEQTEIRGGIRRPRDPSAGGLADAFTQRLFCPSQFGGESWRR